MVANDNTSYGEIASHFVYSDEGVKDPFFNGSILGEARVEVWNGLSS